MGENGTEVFKTPKPARPAGEDGPPGGGAVEADNPPTKYFDATENARSTPPSSLFKYMTGWWRGSGWNGAAGGAPAAGAEEEGQDGAGEEASLGHMYEEKGTVG